MQPGALPQAVGWRGEQPAQAVSRVPERRALGQQVPDAMAGHAELPVLPQEQQQELTGPQAREQGQVWLPPEQALRAHPA
jgi:hypothetical protein